ncbi:type 1 fimbrial protein [Enterobacter cloacae complex sp. P6RS]|uniref:fimbrial protein n=1 Tax=unclassified Enterobacter cloacae complex TaxID=2757714 RepID=UPI001874FC6E|nr:MULTISPECIES: fimbrial protein [unclassified Enterobacter cloacae complex]MBE4916814.1 type 1 fimbrial protein [Enterobacter cloacae complex sp. P4RS]MBE4994523.1 type 1 fimbrial protein [Enterobacter cloacae complex sp. P6RS]
MKNLAWVLYVFLSCMIQRGYAASDGMDNVHFHGALVAEPCKILDSDANILLDFGTVIESYLYEYHRTLSKPFAIHLTDCDPSLYNTVSVTFQGTADSELTDFLALDPTSTAKGVAIGLTLSDGTPLAVNKASPYSMLSSGNNTLYFKTFIEAKPSGLLNNSLQVGEFRSVATFVLSYQ